MKNGTSEIIGKRITGVVFKSPRDRRATPCSELFLLFDDGTYFELYSLGSPILPTSGIRGGGVAEVVAYIADAYQLDYKALLKPDVAPVAERTADAPSA